MPKKNIAQNPSISYKTTYHSATGIYETIFHNGLKLLVVERHHVPLVAVLLAYRVGSVHSTPGTTGLAHFIEHMMFKGTQQFKKGKIDAITQQLGGSNNAFTTYDYTAYYFNFTKEHWGKALEIEADRMIQCQWTQREIECEKNVILEELASNLDQPTSFLLEETQQFLLKQHGYRYPILGWKKDLESLHAQDLYSFYHSYYAPNNAVLVVVGDVEVADVCSKVNHFFSKIPSRPVQQKQMVLEYPTDTKRRLTLYHQVSVPEFAVAFPICTSGDIDSYSLDLLDIALSWGKTSRLYRRFVEGERLVHHINTTSTPLHDPGIFWITGELLTDVEPHTLETALLDELKKCSETLMPAYELQKAKNILATGTIFSQETMFDVADKIAQMEMEIGYKELGKLQKFLNQITPKHIQAVARKYLNPEHSTMAWMLPKKAPTAVPVIQISTDRPIAKTCKPNIRLKRQSWDFRLNVKKHSKQHSMMPSVHHLPNGLEVILLENPVLPEVVATLHLKKLFGVDPLRMQGRAYLFGRILSEGTLRHSSQEIAEALEFMGTGISTQYNEIAVKVLDKNIEEVLPWMAEIAQYPLLDETALCQEKRKHLAELLSFEDDAQYKTARAFDCMIYGIHPYANPFYGTLKTIPQITIEHIRNFHTQYWTPNRAILLLIGRLHEQRMLSIVEQHFGNWKSTPLQEAKFPDISLAIKPQELYVPMEKEQLTVYFGHLGIRRSNPDYYKLLVLEQILGHGAGFTDRLNKKIRDELGLCYNISAGITSSAGHEPGLFRAALATTPQHYAMAMKTLRQEILKIQKYGITETELASVKTYLCNRVFFAQETNDALSAYLLQCCCHNLGFDYLEKFPKIIQQISKKEVQKVAQQYLHPEVATTVVAGPIHKI